MHLDREELASYREHFLTNERIGVFKILAIAIHIKQILENKSVVYKMEYHSQSSIIQHTQMNIAILKSWLWWANIHGINAIGKYWSQLKTKISRI